jgi:hypothetical protein
MELNMKRLSARTNVNPAFKKAQPLPALPNHPAATGRSWLQLGCAGWMKFRAAAEPRQDSGPSLVDTVILRAVAQPGNTPVLSQAWAGRSL